MVVHKVPPAYKMMVEMAVPGASYLWATLSSHRLFLNNACLGSRGVH